MTTKAKPIPMDVTAFIIQAIGDYAATHNYGPVLGSQVRIEINADPLPEFTVKIGKQAFGVIVYER